MKSGVLGLLALILSAGLVAPALAHAAQTCASLDTPAQIAECEQAIGRETDAAEKIRLLFRRAYVYNEHQRYEDALVDLGAALALQPSNAAILQERAYTFNALGRYGEAETDLNAQAALAPDSVTLYQERAFARFYQGNLEGSLSDRERAVSLAPNDADSLLSRAEIEGWLGRFDEAARDIAAAAAMGKSGEARQAAAELALLRTATPRGNPETLCAFDRLFGTSPPPPNIIGDCTAAFLRASTAAGRADALTTRSVAWRLVRQDETAGLADLQIAAALDPDDWQRHANLGQAYVLGRHSWAGRNEFDQSLQLHPSWVAYAGRSAANFNLNEIDAAIADANESMRRQPNQQALMVLGDIAFHHQSDPASARRYWLAAYDLGARDDGLMQRLADVGVADPAHEPRQ